jgi:RNA polymerase sigma-70 factor, ECF subfamily
MVQNFITRNSSALHEAWLGVTKPHEVTEPEFAERLAAIALRGAGGAGRKSAQDSTEAGDQDGVDSGAEREFLAGIKGDDLCLAIACEKGNEAAWLDFEAVYRSSMIAAARALTRDDGEAEDLVQFVYGELYGIRLDGDRRLSKLAHYSGRGSLGGWLRAVVYQCFIDRKRLTARFEQVEEVEEFDRLANASAAQGNTGISSPPRRPDQVEDRRLREAAEVAIARAFALIESRDRLLLTSYYFDDMKLREIGQVMGVHEATVSRWVARAQREVRRRTEEILQRDYGMRRAEIAECLELAARSEVDLRNLLRDVKGPAVERAP